MCLGRDVLEFAAAQVVIKDVFCAGQATGTAHHRNPFPYAGGSLAGSRRGGKIQVNVIRHYQVGQSVAIVIDEGASGAPRFTGPSHSRFLANFAENAALIAIKTVLSIVCDIEIFPAVIVVVAHADALAPSGCGKPCFHSHVSESSIVIIAVQMISRGLASRKSLKRRAVYQEDIGPA